MGLAHEGTIQLDCCQASLKPLQEISSNIKKKLFVNILFAYFCNKELIFDSGSHLSENLEFDHT